MKKLNNSKFCFQIEFENNESTYIKTYNCSKRQFIKIFNQIKNLFIMSVVVKLDDNYYEIDTITENEILIKD